METHPDPDNAVSDEPDMVPLHRLEALLSQLLQRILLRLRNLAAMELLVCDVDGVLTDGGVHYDEPG